MPYNTFMSSAQFKHQQNLSPAKQNIDLSKVTRSQSQASTISNETADSLYDRSSLLIYAIDSCLNNTVDDQIKTIKPSYFHNFLPFKRYNNTQPPSSNESEEIKDGVTVSITKRKLIERVTCEGLQDQILSNILLHTYKWYFTEVEMFTMFLERFKMSLPFCLSASERRGYIENRLSCVQLKVLNFLKQWIQHYSYILENSSEDKEIILEFVFLMASHLDVSSESRLLLSEIFSLIKNQEIDFPPFQTERKRGPRVTSLCEFFIELPHILDHAHFIAKQLCILDAENISQVTTHEVFKKAWTSSDKKLKAPNLTLIAESSTRLSRFVSYLILMNKKNSLRIMTFEYLLGLCDKLIRLRNYNSAYAIYLGVTSPAVHRLSNLIEKNIGREYKEIFCHLHKFFSTTNKSELFRKRQNEAPGPSVPHVGMYLGDICFLEELPDFLDKEKRRINIKKFHALSKTLPYILNHKESYGFQKVENIYNFLKDLPSISEEKIYELSFKIQNKTACCC